MTRPGRDGFTLIEVLAVLFLTALVFGVALDFYVDLSNQSQHATDATRGVRRAVSLLDRVGHDFERTLLVKKPAEEDPLAHPWIFVAESRHAEGGADRVKFITRRPADERTREGQSDIAVVSYALRPSAQGDDFELVRWSQPELPEALDRDFPPVDDPRGLVLADGLRTFAVRFLDENGEWVDEWDSSQLLDSSELPVAVEIEVSMASPDPTDDPDAEPLYRRRILLPVRPLDLETLTDPVAYADAGGQQDQECELTVADCIDLSLLGGAAGGGGGGAGGGGGPVDLSALNRLSPQDREVVRQLSGGNLAALCWDQFRDAYGDHPAVRPQCR